MSRANVLVLGGREATSGSSRSQPLGRAAALGWHLKELQAAASRHSVQLHFADYETLRSRLHCGGDKASTPSGSTAWCQLHDGTDSRERSLADFEAILTRTMPAGSMEQITFRLAVLHDFVRRQSVSGPTALVNPPTVLVNPPSALEFAIDKYATLARVQSLGVPTPPTQVVQSRAAAMEAFENLGGDVVIKPIFGGEGRGVMRVRDAELAWTAFSTLAQVNAVMYVQQFVPPGGVDLRVLVIGDHSHAIRRRNAADFRTNVRGGGQSELVPMDATWDRLARQVSADLGLKFAAIDWLETETGELQLIEVNGIPGWKGAQRVVQESIADQILEVLVNENE
ncbi:ATP-grasp domain-containing protein [Rhodopirellula sp. P2]|uniref:ATP-grasp domain-containing protein n=1 Tax=Rhodopirellula sp. P2 TaxID=2127060 RepID=UPI002367909E|nr:RimK family alpha-L-glutamate ligase [Rhodopirellula sp. P2]WDQ18865.1 RimK family alpha-L-glutamate ligase [Rhodopirellula sp. P2]